MCSFMCSRSIKFTMTGPCKIMAKVAHFVFTTHHSKDHNFHPRPWNDTISKSFNARKIMFFGHRSLVAVLCSLFFFFFAIKKKRKLYSVLTLWRHTDVIRRLLVLFGINGKKRLVAIIGSKHKGIGCLE